MKIPWRRSAAIPNRQARSLGYPVGGGSTSCARLRACAGGGQDDAKRLSRRGVAVVHCEGAVDNALQPGDGTGCLPFRDAAFDLVLNRREAFAAAEVARVLAPGGRFLTEQVGSAPDQFHALLGLRPPARPAFDLDLLVSQAVRAGLAVENAEAARAAVRFADVGALALYLRMVPWAVPGFDITTHRSALESAAGRDILVYQEHFLLCCRR